MTTPKPYAADVISSSATKALPMTTPTPRTDAEEGKTGDDFYLHGYVEADFARQLERDLAAAQELLATMRPFWTKHALGPLAKPSCLCCGKSDYEKVAVQHMELPGVVICSKCKEAQEARQAAEERAERAEANERNYRQVHGTEQSLRLKAEALAAQNARLLREIVDAWDNGKEDDSIIASRRVTDAFIKARAAIAGEPK